VEPIRQLADGLAAGHLVAESGLGASFALLRADSVLGLIGGIIDIAGAFHVH
jgi:hypothetical protein